MFLSDKITALALSGGVDSSVAARLLLESGRDVSAVYFIMSEAHLAGVCAAEAAAKTLGVTLDTLDLRGRFDKDVVVPFCTSYCAGITPNPCVRCNPAVKFAALCEYADSVGARFVSTGHYARVGEKDGVFLLQKASSAQRDQSYMLCRLPQSVLSRCVFPLGMLEKNAVRKIAHESALANANAPDSQEICFIPDGDYAGYMNCRGFFGKTGSFISPNGETLAPHSGVEHYTVGQRRGLGVTFGKPVYVREITDGGDIVLSENKALLRNAADIEHLFMNPLYEKIDKADFNVKLRSAAKPAHCFFERTGSASARLSFESPQRAPARGQEAVLYDGEAVAGCGTIAFVE